MADPRIAEWQDHVDHARRLSESLRAHAQATLDVPRSRRLRLLSDLCEDYARGFARWADVDHPVTARQKFLEYEAFDLICDAVEVELGRTPPRRPPSGARLGRRIG